ncbi:hypothetical protein BDW72DRAFT_178807 [Aspergillus terricola var. indicus]
MTLGQYRCEQPCCTVSKCDELTSAVRSVRRSLDTVLQSSPSKLSSLRTVVSPGNICLSTRRMKGTTTTANLIPD